MIHFESDDDILFTPEVDRREVDSRRTADIEVTIWYLKRHDLLLLSLVEIKSDRAYEFVIEPDKVADALQHPYSYASEQGVEF